MGIKMKCEVCLRDFVATTKEETLPDDEGYVSCHLCKSLDSVGLTRFPDTINEEYRWSNETDGELTQLYDSFHTNQWLLERSEELILAIAPYVGVKVNHTDYTKGYHRAWKAFSRELRRIKTERGDNQ
tara:strand:+ start:175 stop:558 length:384 start_codon:yes stop_codon:yes gene_type:complete